MHELAGRAADFIDLAEFAEDNLLRVWSFYDAPAALRDLSEHGGDEDWVLLIPPQYSRYVSWAEGGQRFGPCDVSEHQLPNGWEVRIGAHS
jgi:hypothetical protein